MNEFADGASAFGRHDRIFALSAEHGADGVLISNLPDIRWICGFTGSNALLLITAAGSFFVTDPRYTEQARAEVSCTEILISEGSLYEAVQNLAPARLVYQGDHLSVDKANKLAAAYSATVLVSIPGFLERERGQKEESEIVQIQKALSISESVLEEIPGFLTSGITERELAAEIDYHQRLKGSDGPAFDSIVAFGENGALPHSRPGGRSLQIGDCVLVDTGCRVGGFVSDITRNFFFGVPDQEYLAIFEIVQRSVDESLKMASAGIQAKDLDAVARKVIENAGYGSLFSHSLGHGVGLEIHEWPRVSKNSDSVLMEKSVITVEPGIYIPGKFGVRIEEMIVIEEGGCRPLNTLSTDLRIIK